MCGIVGAIAERNISPLLLEGLKKLEYRGYDSAGIAIADDQPKINRVRVLGKVNGLVDALKTKPLTGTLGIAHTRWATHGQPSEQNAHPHVSQESVAVVHNGIIENYLMIQQKLENLGYQFQSQTDTEVICHLLHYHLQQTQNHRLAIRHTLDELQGAYALGIIFDDAPGTLFAVRHGSPLVIGVGEGEHFIASDQIALLATTKQFIHLKEGELAELTPHTIYIEDDQQQPAHYEIITSQAQHDDSGKGAFKHYMQKEIFEQPQALTETLSNRLYTSQIDDGCFGPNAHTILPTIKRVHIVACGTSYHAGLVAKDWLESLAGIPCQVEVASEFRYRQAVTEPNTLFVALSQSGETADTLAALRKAKETQVDATLAICNVSHSTLVQEADLTFITQAGTEIGVAATKTFTAQLTALLLLTLALGKHHQLDAEAQQSIINDLKLLPALAQQFTTLDKQIETLAHQFIDKQQTLYLGRGSYHAIAMEGALKLKEISYMHAEAHPAGELKHGPLALVDSNMPVIVLAPNNELLDKLTSNIKEVEARGGHLYVFADETLNWHQNKNLTLIKMPQAPLSIAPIAYTIPLQLLAYHVAVLKGTDVDQPRNLAKSVTVE
ncbi:MAG: glutamine--fructose-6-phosphate transaminase (isomerizing) [Coxiella sp. (in: Bacteria)]|nr:MAG: glutamine--fructose-6-phosphate transaminase (isomerizing) [Coxiella sp. (in: g-proteobacteria)]